MIIMYLTSQWEIMKMHLVEHAGFPIHDSMTHRNQMLVKKSSDKVKGTTALYVNGYRRDWFGFNKGALIGSFDGVRWFAMGGGRRVTAKSTKLFLAMNGVLEISSLLPLSK